MGAPYIARAPKKVLVRIPRNEGYTTVPSGMATLRLIPSPLDKPQDADSTHAEPRGASPLDRPQQITTSLPPAYTRNIHTESLSEQTVHPDQQQTSPDQQQTSPPRAAVGAVVSEADRSVVLQGTRGQAAQYQAERSSSPGHGHLAAAATATATIAPRSPALHYQGHFTAISGRCQQEAATAWRQQQPPPFTDFIAGQVWRALMMASQQQQQQQQQQQVSGVVRGGPVGGKRTRDVGEATTMEGDTDEPTRKISRVSQTQRGLQDGASVAGHSPSVMYSPPPGTAPPHTAFHTAMPTPPSTPPSAQQTCSNSSVDGTVHLAQPSSPKRLTHPQQPLMSTSPPALHLPIMFPPVFPQSMTSIKSPQQFSLRRSSSSSSSSGPAAVSGSGGGGGLGAGPPQHQAGSQLTVGRVSPVTNPLPHHHHPLAALLQPTHGSASAAHTEPAAAPPYLTAVTGPTPIAMRMADRNGDHHQGGTTTAHTGHYQGPVPVYSRSSSNAKTSSSRNSVVDSSSSSRGPPAAHPMVGATARASPMNSDSSTTLTSHCT